MGVRIDQSGQKRATGELPHLVVRVAALEIVRGAHCGDQPIGEGDTAVRDRRRTDGKKPIRTEEHSIASYLLTARGGADALMRTG
jgi:hypothetical protein